jgi:uncharacterized membrane protein
MSMDEERAGQALRTLMREYDLPPTGTDVGRAVRVGRRRNTRHRVLVAAAAAVGVMGASSAVALGLPVPGLSDQDAPAGPATATCAAAQRLAVPGLRRVLAIAADPTGRYVVGSGVSDSDGRQRMVLWRDGEPTVVEMPKGTRPVDVNSAGVVVGGVLTYPVAVSVAGKVVNGTMTYPPELGSSWVYQDGQMRDLARPRGYLTASVTGINERGDMTGTSANQDDSWIAVVWPAGAPDKPRRLDAPMNAVPEDISDDGTVVGSLYEPGHMPPGANGGKAYAWSPDGRGRELDVPTGWAGARAMRVSGDWIYGHVHRGPESSALDLGLAPVRWRLDGRPAEVLSAGVDGKFVWTTASGWWMASRSGPIMVTGAGRAVRLDLGEPVGVPGPTDYANLVTDAFWVAAGRDTVVIYNNTPTHARAEHSTEPEEPTWVLRRECTVGP